MSSPFRDPDDRGSVTWNVTVTAVRRREDGESCTRSYTILLRSYTHHFHDILLTVASLMVGMPHLSGQESRRFPSTRRWQRSYINSKAALMSIIKYFLVHLSEIKNEISLYWHFCSLDAMDVLICKWHKMKLGSITLLFIFFLEIIWWDVRWKVGLVSADRLLDIWPLAHPKHWKKVGKKERAVGE